MSHVTTHILDTSTGLPSEGVTLHLQKPNGSDWETIASGVTNSDGRVTDLLKDGETLKPGNYRMFFETGAYFKKQGVKAFYPEVGIVFETFDTTHYHVPLLLNPFGYSTYRGS
jgi:hydroxyisourate hydrolase